MPLPEANSFDELNTILCQHAQADQTRTMAGRSASIAEFLAAKRPLLTPLPPHPLAVGEMREVLVRSTSRIRFETNDYSVPVRYVGSRLSLHADPFWIQLSCGSELVATHPRSYARQQVIEDFRHYVPLLLEKPFAVPFASAVRGGALPPSWERHRQRLVVARDAVGCMTATASWAGSCICACPIQLPRWVRPWNWPAPPVSTAPTRCASSCIGLTNRGWQAIPWIRTAIPTTNCPNPVQIWPPITACSRAPQVPGLGRKGRAAMSMTRRETPANPRPHPASDPQLALVQSYLKQLRLPAIARDCISLAREAEQQGAGYLDYLQRLLARRSPSARNTNYSGICVKPSFPTSSSSRFLISFGAPLPSPRPRSLSLLRAVSWPRARMCCS